MLMVKESYEENFKDLIRYWFSGDDWDRKQKYYPVKDFIEWAEKTRIEVPWFSWAEKEGSIKTIKPLDARKEKTYQIIIGVLLEPEFNSQVQQLIILVAKSICAPRITHWVF